MLKKCNLQQVFVFLLAIIVWVNDLQVLKPRAFWSSLFLEKIMNDIAHGSKRRGGWGMEA